MDTLEQGEYGFLFSHYQQNIIGDPILEPGVKWTGPLNGIVRFPSVSQMFYFTNDNRKCEKGELIVPPVHSRTFDGLLVYVELAFQWALQPENLRGIYGILGGAEDLLDGELVVGKPSFSASVVRFAQAAITKVCSQYTAAQFFGNQSAVEEKMYAELQSAFNQPDKGLVISVQGLQLVSVDLPDPYEQAILLTQALQQDYNTALAERDTMQMNYTTLLMQAVYIQEQLMIDVKANATSLRQANDVYVEQYMNFQIKQANSYKELLLALTNASDPFSTLFDLMRLKALKAHNLQRLTLTM